MKEKPPSPSNVPEKAMEGRQITKDGKDLGDRDFHETAYNLTPEVEEATLDDLKKNLVGLEEQQVKSVAERDKQLGAQGYRQLLTRYPSHPNAKAWQAALAILEPGS